MTDTTIAVTRTLSGAILTDSSGDAVTLSGTWTVYYDETPGGGLVITNTPNAVLDLVATGADGTTTFTSAYANNDGTVDGGYEITDNGATTTSGTGYNALYLDWETARPTSLAVLSDSTFTSLKDANGTLYDLKNAGSDAGTVTCFAAGTAIATPAGSTAVEDLRIGDMVALADGTATPVRWIGRRIITTRFADPLAAYPIRIKAGALGDNLPLRDLLVSPCHAMLIGDVLAQAGSLVNGISIIRTAPEAAQFTYYHIELASHGLLLAEGAAAESFVDNVDRMAFDNWVEHELLFGTGAPIAEMDRPRVKSARQLPETIRTALHERAEALYGATRAA